MRINTNIELKDFKDEPLRDSRGGVLTARDIMSMALNSEDNEHRLTAEKKNQAFQIMSKLWKQDECELTVEQAALIKERVGLFYSTLTYGRICELLEGKEEMI